MKPVPIDDLLPLVEMPSRYLGTEPNSVHKDLGAVELKFALAFPDLYEIGMSHFGLQILYHLLNREAEIAAERVFAPAPDMAERLRAAGRPLFSLESRLPVGDFDILGFSLLYELNYTNVLGMLELAGLPLRAAERGAGHPLVIAGGPCTCNPEPVAPFFDAVVIGDGEAAVLEIGRRWLAWKRDGGADRRGLLERLSEVEGVYIPSDFKAEVDARGFQQMRPVDARRPKPVRAVVDDLARAPFPDRPVVPYGRPVHDRLRIEISRGCSRGCRFCQAGMIYRPVRERPADQLLALADASLAATGFEDLSLLSLSSGDYGCLQPLLESLMARWESERVAVSLPSVRAGALTPELIALIQRVRKTGFTIAPEAGSQRLRDVINKNIDEAEITAAVDNAFQLGWRVIKLYFMIGLPTETDADLEGIVGLVRRLRGRIRRGGQLNVSVATFIPKPHTPFQWAPQLPLEEAVRRMDWLKRRLRMPGVKFKWQNPEVSLLEGVFARGDRRLAGLLEAAHGLGCQFDGWSDRFDLDRWRQAFAAAGIDPDFYTTRSRSLDEPLPWDHLDMRIGKEFLMAEWHRALAGKTVADCRYGACGACGSCDFRRTRPRVHRRVPEALGTNAEGRGGAPRPPAYRKMALCYAKTGPARYFGHLELKNIFLRAFRRAGIRLQFSEGFHPQPRVSFADALPIGMESESELLVVTAEAGLAPGDLVRGLNAQLPPGLQVTGCEPLAGRGAAPHAPATHTYRVKLAQGRFDPRALADFLARPNPTLTRRRPGGRLKKIEIKDILVGIELPEADQLRVTLKAAPGLTVRPAELIRHIFSLSDDQLRRAAIVKMRPAGGAGCLGPRRPAV